MSRSLKVFGYGLLLFIVTMVLLFVTSIITGLDQPVNLWWVGVIMAVLLVYISRWFSKRLHPTTGG